MTKEDRKIVIDECAREAERHAQHLRETQQFARAKEAECIARAIRRMKD